MIKLKRSYQGGWTFLGLLTFLLVAGIFVAVGFKLAPAYADHQTLKSIMRSVELDQQMLAKNKRQIELSIRKKMGINNLRLPQEFIKITKDKGEVTMDVDYEVRIPMFYNVAAVVMFKEQYKGKPID
ncbi:DUF4845 domain-containing protein [Motiliproteus coralliicola]|uniref:DUF4845 domain-containing protein n=1 Tax=Motiliproteus coralliicola TaxID=2283196 RepID=A0A369WNQ5_9GAMM|nr:DUF4845 domain-containing protein [Motiliproteus coralliicola]RDE22699.1 DUF4845 domain-containing protein [Motiliproteus coralliicola]